MRGTITTRHLLTHARIILGEFGWKVYLRCLMRSVVAPGKTTFLGCVGDCTCSHQSSKPSPTPVG